MRRAPDQLPFSRDRANPLAGLTAGQVAGMGVDDFALYCALRDTKRATGLFGAQNYLVSWPFNPSVCDSTLYPPLTNSRLMMVPQLVPPGEAVDGVAYVQHVAGAYTSVNTNGVAAYSFDGVTFTRVAQGTNANLWKSAQGFVAAPFGSQLAASGSWRLLWACGLWNQSAVPTTPVIAGMTVGGGAIGANSPGLATYSFQVDNVGSTNFPASFAAAAVTASDTNHFWLAFYRNHT